MYKALLHSHSGLRYIVLLFILIVIVQSLIGWQRQRKFDGGHRRVSNISTWLLHIQWVVGIALFFVSTKVLFDADTMKSTLLRFFTLEHPVMMLIATLLITIGHLKAKAYTNYKSHKKLFWYNLVGLVIIIAAIPWPFRAELGTGWF